MASLDNLSEEIIKRKLQIDGDGMGDDRKLLSLARAYLTFVDGENDTEEIDLQNLKRMISITSQAEYSAKRTVVSFKENEEAKDQFADLATQVKSEIIETKRQIVESKALLEDATKHRKYSMEYDALAKLIESKPDRKMTELKRMGLQLELDTLKGREQRIDDQLNQRKILLSQLSGSMEHLKEFVLEYDDKYIKNSSQSSRSRSNGGTPMDVDSNSQSDPPSPAAPATPEVTTNGSVPPARKNGTENGTSSTASSTVEKSKSEKYEDLSESEGEDHS